MAIVTLLTDFGQLDTYVGQVKGAILAIAPLTPVVDLTHAVPPQDVRSGAFLLWTAVEVFPPGTVHLAVVDPGVGSQRRGLALRTRRGSFLVGPDNGLLLPAARRLGGVEHSVALDRPEVMRPGVSNSFHGRDVFGPVAALLASGRTLQDVGSPATDLLEEPFLPPPIRVGDTLSGKVVHVDAYGNLVTNLENAGLPERFTVRLNGRELPSARCYADVGPGDPLALPGSSGLVEISVRDGNAAESLAAGRDSPVELLLA